MAFPGLSASRARVLDALVELCRGPADAAASTLGLGPTQWGEVGANARLRREPCAPAIEVYTGVLYEALSAQTLTQRAHRRLDDQVAIASALWGLVRPDDLIPAYRLSAGVRLPGIGPLASVWRDPITEVLRDTEGLILDLRSGAYASLAPLPADVAARAATVRVLTEKAGRRTVVSHNNKATKGRIVRTLAQARSTPGDVEALAKVLDQAGYRVERCPERGRIPILDIILEG